MVGSCRGCVLPEDLYYDLDYVWLRPGDDGLVTVGVTDPGANVGREGRRRQHQKAGCHYPCRAPRCYAREWQVGGWYPGTVRSNGG